MSKKDDKRILALLEIIAQQSMRISELEQRLDDIDAVWPQIIGEDNGTD